MQDIIDVEHVCSGTLSTSCLDATEIIGDDRWLTQNQIRESDVTLSHGTGSLADYHQCCESRDMTSTAVDRNTRRQAQTLLQMFIDDSDVTSVSRLRTRNLSGLVNRPTDDVETDKVEMSFSDLKRIKNNVASQASRLRRKRRNKELEKELLELAAENKRLQTEVAALEQLVAKTKQIIQEWMQNTDVKPRITTQLACDYC